MAPSLLRLLLATAACCVALAPLWLTGFNSEFASRSTGPQSTKTNSARCVFGSTTGKEQLETTKNKDTSIWDVTHTVNGSVAPKNNKDEDYRIDHVSATALPREDASVGTHSDVEHFSERATTVGDGRTTTEDGKATIGDGKATISYRSVTSGFVALPVAPIVRVPSNIETTQRPTPEETTAHYLSTDDTAPSSTDTYWQTMADDYVYTYVSPILIVSGTIGNAMSVIILQNRLFRSSSTGFILTALAVLNVAVLNTGLMQFWLTYAFSVKLRDMSTFSCRFHNLLTYYLHQLASWTLILLTIERSVAVCCPLRCRELCSKRRILLSWCCIAVILFAANSFFLVGFDLLPEAENGRSGNDTTTDAVVTYVCYVRSEWSHFFEDQWCWIDAFLGDFFPFAAVLIGNIVTVTKIKHSRKARLGQLNSATRLKEKMASTTAMLISVSFLFLLLTLPIDAFIIYYAYSGTAAFSDRDQAIYDFGYAVVTMLYYTNNALDFLMYLVSGRKFRQALLETFLPCRQVTNRNSQSGNHTRGASVAIRHIGSQSDIQSAKKSRPAH